MIQSRIWIWHLSRFCQYFLNFSEKSVKIFLKGSVCQDFQTSFKSEKFDEKRNQLTSQYKRSELKAPGYKTSHNIKPFQNHSNALKRVTHPHWHSRVNSFTFVRRAFALESRIWKNLKEQKRCGLSSNDVVLDWKIQLKSLQNQIKNDRKISLKTI